MRSITRTYSARNEPEVEEKPLSFRHVALLFPPKDVLARVRKNHTGSNGVVDPEQSLEPMFDEDRGVDFPISSKDIRVIIAQDDVGVSIDRVLYDSKHSRDAREKTLKQTRTSPKISLFRRVGGEEECADAKTHLSKPQLPRLTTRSTPTSPKRSQAPTSTPSSFVQSNSFRRTQNHSSLADSRQDAEIPIMGTSEETDSFIDCMFGKSQMRYKGVMTKHHVLQRQPVDPLHANGEKGTQCGDFAFTRGSNNQLPQSTPEELAKLRTPCLLVSRTFAVPLLDGDFPAQTPSRRASTPLESTPERKDSRANRARSTPQFGVALVIPLAKSRRAPSSESGLPDIVNPVDGVGQALRDVEDPFQAVMEHWQAIDRTLNALQATATVEIHQKLKAQISAQGRKGAIRYTRMIKLEPNILQQSDSVKQATDASMARLVRSFHIPDVVPQGEWNVWRDELLDMTRSRDKSHKYSLDHAKISFTQIVLTAALSTNLSWLGTVAPPQFQGRLRAEERKLRNSEGVAQSRTLVVAVDQNKARHLLFLLAKFLPAPRPQFERAAPPDLRSTPKVSALTQGLKAVVNGTGESNGNGLVPAAPRVANLVPVFQEPYHASPGTSPVKCGLRIGPRSDLGTTKVAAGKIVLPSERGTPAMPIASAPGSSYTTPAGSPEVRPSSSASAQGNLMRHLQRENSGTTCSTDSTGFWNSFRSNTWSLGPRRDSSMTERSDGAPGTSQRDQFLPSILKNGRSSTGRHGGTKLVRMLEEVEGSKLNNSYERKDSAFHTRESTPSHFSHTPIASQFEPSSSDRSNLQYSYDAREGTVVVDMLGGNGSGPAADRKTRVPVAPESFPAYHGAESLVSTKGAFANTLSSGATHDKAAGYLEAFHPDYALQAVKPYADLLEDVKRAMKAEPSPRNRSLPSLDEFFPVDDWIDVCSTVVVDADSLTTRRLSLRRHVRYHLLKQDEAIAFPRHLIKVNRGSHNLTSPIEDPESDGSIKVTKSEEMDSISRTYRRNDQGQKLGWKDKKIVCGEERCADARNKCSSVDDRRRSHSSDSRHCVTNGDFVKANTSAKDFARPTNGHHHNGAGANGKLSHTTDIPTKTIPPVGDDLSAFIDKQAKVKATKPVPKITATSKVPKRNAEGKITGWQDVDADLGEEPGLHDLPTGFSDCTRENVVPVIYTQTVEETFADEAITTPDPAIIQILETMMASSDSRSAAPSRANSVHGRGHSRSNSLSGSGLLELQQESKRVVEDALQGLIISIANEKHQGPQHRPSVSSGLFSFGRSAAASHPELSVLHQSIAKWLG